MSENVKPYRTHLGKKEEVEQMFDNISRKYDFLNRVLSVGIDVLWRRKVVRLLKGLLHRNVLDIATGTADLAIEISKIQPNKIVGLDISEGMLEVARRKVERRGLSHKVSLVRGDSENLPFEADSFDVVTVAFGVRNFENLEKGIAEIYRVLQFHGALVVLEFSQPERFPVKHLYHLYNRYILPTIGRMVSKDRSAYTYLPESIKAFPYGGSFLKILKKIGFKQTKCIPLTGGIASIYVAKKL